MTDDMITRIENCLAICPSNAFASLSQQLLREAMTEIKRMEMQRRRYEELISELLMRSCPHCGDKCDLKEP